MKTDKNYKKITYEEIFKFAAFCTFVPAVCGFGR
jgi:hypothetical protein